MTNSEKLQRLDEIQELLGPFCKQYLDDELTGYVIKLKNKLGRKRTLAITRGKPEIWAAAIVYVIARLNFLFDKSNSLYLSADTICAFFKTKKSTVGQKATLIESACKIGWGDKEFCRAEISDIFTFYQTPEGIIIPKSLLPDMIGDVIIFDDEEVQELRGFSEERKRESRVKVEEKKKHEAEELSKKKFKNQTNLFSEDNE